VAPDPYSTSVNARAASATFSEPAGWKS
jgi:hypothetical protein